MKRLLILIGLMSLLAPICSHADTVDVDVYATRLLERNGMMIDATTSAHQKNTLSAARETVKALQSRYDHHVIVADELYPLLVAFDSITTSGTLSDQDYADFLQKAQPTLNVICYTC